MLIGDTAWQRRQQWRKSVDSTRAIAQGALSDQKRQVVEAENAENALRQMGRPMLATELIGRLRKANSDLQFQINSLHNWAILYPRATVTPTGTAGTTLAYTGVWFENSVLPEYTVLHPTYDTAWDSDKKDIVKTLKTVKPTVGWRQVLGRLILAGLLQPARARELFGADDNIRKSYHEMESRPGANAKLGPIQLI